MSETEITNEERLNIVDAARALGFDYHSDQSGRLVCTIDQLIMFSASVAAATAKQVMDRREP